MILYLPWKNYFDKYLLKVMWLHAAICKKNITSSKWHILNTWTQNHIIDSPVPINSEGDQMFPIKSFMNSEPYVQNTLWVCECVLYQQAFIEENIITDDIMLLDYGKLLSVDGVFWADTALTGDEVNVKPRGHGGKLIQKRDEQCLTPTHAAR